MAGSAAHINIQEEIDINGISMEDLAAYTCKK